ncbi:hypothetical protein [Pseudalkalibacillus caeni]|uniref:Uncharacterized protein n=1 Tax=Exobacillus caeni TaxID=2574798 RepID=A0A5R9F1M3_9BACL|nr:hypothetical protein [Pseudalkalibacillus caeni]TLS35348.1 hypothetical protein FCL54_20900 [Pseudalkalibacillus caeni]
MNKKIGDLRKSQQESFCCTVLDAEQRAYQGTLYGNQDLAEQQCKDISQRINPEHERGDRMEFGPGSCGGFDLRDK